MFKRLQKKYPTIFGFVLGYLVCSAVSLLLTVLDFRFYALWVVFGSVTIALILAYLYKPVLLLFHQIKPLDLPGSDMTNRIPIYEQKSKRPNAYASGFLNMRMVSFTKPLLELCNPQEIRAVLMHELAHHHYNDYVWVGAVLLTIANSIGVLSASLSANLPHALLVSLILSLPGVLLYLMYSRFKESRADEYVAKHLDNPADLANALTKMQRYMTDQGYVYPAIETFATRYLATHSSTVARSKYLLS